MRIRVGLQATERAQAFHHLAGAEDSPEGWLQCVDVDLRAYLIETGRVGPEAGPVEVLAAVETFASEGRSGRYWGTNVVRGAPPSFPITSAEKAGPPPAPPPPERPPR